MPLKVCWAGWTGPDMSEMASGVLGIDPEMQFYILGSGAVFDEGPYFMKPGRRISYFVNNEKFFKDLNIAKYDVLIHNTYAFSAGHRPEIYPLDETGVSYLVNPHWDGIPSFKILHDGESWMHFDFFSKIVHRFDGVITYNRDLKDHCDKLSIPCYLSYLTCPASIHDMGLERDIDVSYSGSCVSVGYRKELRDVLEALPDSRNAVIFEGAYGGVDVDTYYTALSRSKIHQCTHSCASGEKYPMHIKNREAKALLSGAMPIIERFEEADGYLKPGTEKVIFDDLEELPGLIAYYLEHEDERRAIVEAGQKKVRGNFTCDILFKKAFEHFGFL